jgi:hypothetical protein
MSPEQEAGGSAGVDARADVYSLGAMLRWLGGTEFTPPLQAISRKAMAADLADRYPDVPALSADVARFLDGHAVSAYSESLLHRALRIARRHRVALGIVVAYLAGRTLIWLSTGR